MRIFVGVTDGDWYGQLGSTHGIDEVNFWQPSGTSQFRALSPGELFLFKLHSPANFIVGGGLFGHFSLLPVSLAWAAFETKNGAQSLRDMRQRIEKYRRRTGNHTEDYTIGCILLEQPFFFSRDHSIPIPKDWAPNIVRGKGYETTTEAGLQLWNDVVERLQLSAPAVRIDETPRYGEPVPVRPRLGQGSFRILVTDVYGRRCAVTRERTLPVLQAAHIKPWSDGGEHDIRNGLLLRSDIHVLFDQGYVTVTPDLHFEVSRRIREEYENGRDYYALHGCEVGAPENPAYRPHTGLLRWHNESIYKG